MLNEENLKYSKSKFPLPAKRRMIEFLKNATNVKANACIPPVYSNMSIDNPKIKDKNRNKYRLL